jgi:hypothetical protein
MIEGFVTLQITLLTEKQSKIQKEGKSRPRTPHRPSLALDAASIIVADRYAAMKQVIPEIHLSSGRICQGHQNMNQARIRGLLLQNGECKLRIPKRKVELVQREVARLWAELSTFDTVELYCHGHALPDQAPDRNKE